MRALVDAPLALAPAGARVRARMTDPFAGWSWQGASRADGDPYGPLWRLEPPYPARVADLLTGTVEPFTVELEVDTADGDAATLAAERVWRTATVRERAWRVDGAAVRAFLPVRPAARRAVVVLGGSWGGFAWSAQVAALLASRGLPAAAAAYFDWGGEHDLPTTLSEIPVEAVARAADVLLAGDPAAELAVVGISKGAELALLAAAHDPRVRRVVALAPSSHVWESVRPDGGIPARSSWTLRGRPLPFLAFDADEAFYRTQDKTRLLAFHERALAGGADAARARIPAELIAADVLLVSLERDVVWPSRAMGDAVAAGVRTRAAGGRVRHRVLPAAGHVLLPPGLPANGLDGDPAAAAAADRVAWELTLGHLGLAPPGPAPGPGRAPRTAPARSRPPRRPVT